ncbi:hypothetical protein [Paenibacillus piri]|uniref:Uncharacterized protein n=1 Tax=Paenibacillus piri TaxID=2547395 RepID=A0A4R5KVX5_9BACL|nr:hypothetical protein [Paenibacillus piri]TDG00160.1 hypothetical protein E1757_00480 [Paenibacillus piri]
MQRDECSGTNAAGRMQRDECSGTNAAGRMQRDEYSGANAAGRMQVGRMQEKTPNAIDCRYTHPMLSPDNATIRHVY